jgi:hypothetical protein
MSPTDKRKKAVLSTALVPFEHIDIRRTWHNDKWYYSIADVISALTSSSAPRQYWGTLKGRLKSEGSELLTDCLQLRFQARDFIPCKTMLRMQAGSLGIHVEKSSKQLVCLWLIQTTGWHKLSRVRLVGPFRARVVNLLPRKKKEGNARKSEDNQKDNFPYLMIQGKQRVSS